MVKTKETDLAKYTSAERIPHLDLRATKMRDKCLCRHMKTDGAEHCVHQFRRWNLLVWYYYCRECYYLLTVIRIHCTIESMNIQTATGQVIGVV